jgi:Na+/phosphate symporter
MEKKGMIKKKPYGVFTSLIPLVKNPVYVSIVVLTCIYGAIIGALTFWCPSYLQMRLKRYGYSQEDTARISNIGFGIIVVLGSTVGTTLGAVALDKSGGATGWKGVARALFWCGVFVTIALPFGYVSFLMEEIPMMAMFTIFFFGVFFVLCITSPFQVALNK